MRAEYDSEANVIGIVLADIDRLDRGVEVHPRSIVHLADGEPAQVDFLYPDLGLEEPIAAAVRQFGLDGQALEAAARSALAAPDRAVTVEVAARAAHA
jgi:hypothetical protein